VVDHRIARGGVETAGPVDHPPHVGHSVATLGGEHLAGPPSRGPEVGDVGPLQLPHHPAILTSEHHHRRIRDGRVGVDDITAARDRPELMVGVLGREEGQSRSVETDRVQEEIVGMAAGLPPFGGEVDSARGLVDPEELGHHPRTAGDLILDRAVRPMAIEVGEAIPLGDPDQVAVAEHLPVGAAAGQQIDRPDHVGGATVGNQELGVAGPRIGRQ